jgi:ubiquinol oxidase
MNQTRTLFSGPATANISRAVSRAVAGSSPATTTSLKCSYHLLNAQSPLSRRHFSSTSPTRLEYFEPPKNAPSIKLTPPAWHHPIYNEEDMRAIKIAHRESKTWSDWVALGLCRMFRKGMDLSTGYRHDPTKPYVMSERKWMVRFVFLETVAGVPGMCAGMLRHLGSLRRMNRDNGW